MSISHQSLGSIASRVRTASGHAAGSRPCVRSNAKTIRSCPKAGAGAVRDRAVCQGQVPDLAEMIEGVVERSAGCRLIPGDRDQQFPLQLLSLLVVGEQGADAPEERIVGVLEMTVEADLAEQLDAAPGPIYAPLLDRGRLADANDLMHPEDLPSCRIERGLVPEDPGAADVESHPSGLQRASCGNRRIDRLAGGREHHQVRLCLELAPVLVGGRALRPESWHRTQSLGTRRCCP